MRKLTMTRKKTFVASIMKAYLYVEVKGQGDMVLDGTNCVYLATLKNGESVSVDISNEKVIIFIVFDKTFPNKFHASYILESGDSDVQLYTKAHFQPFKGNPFKITDN